jgi:hypothetical protein
MGLPESRFDDDREYITCGERSLYELATAAAALGLDVELRGGINRPIFEALTSAAGSAPTVGLDTRLPDRGDMVVAPEGGEADLIAAVQLSAARAGEEAGVLVEWLGTGTPVAFPADGVKSADVAIVAANRWAEAAEMVAARLTGVTVLRIEAVPSVYSLSAALAPARILLWPSRLEGMSRIAREARAVGADPVMLGTNPFVTVEDYGRGIVVVPGLDSLAEEAERLLADPDRLEILTMEGKESVRQQVDWDAFLARVEQAVSRVPERPRRASRAALGELLRTRHRAETDGMAAHAERVTPGGGCRASRHEPAGPRRRRGEPSERGGGGARAGGGRARRRDPTAKRGSGCAGGDDRCARGVARRGGGLPRSAGDPPRRSLPGRVPLGPAAIAAIAVVTAGGGPMMSARRVVPDGRWR